MQSPIEFAEASLDWLKVNYKTFPFVVERDIVWTLLQHMNDAIRSQQLPYRVFSDYPILPGERRSQCTDLAILGADESVQVAIEFKYEPSHDRADILKSKLPVVFWGDDGVAKDVQRVREYVGAGRAQAAISVFIDEGGNFAHRAPHPGSSWTDWGHGIKVLYSRVRQGSAPDVPSRSSQSRERSPMPPLPSNPAALQSAVGSSMASSLSSLAESAVTFVDSEDRYLAWIEAHPKGLVVNTERSGNPNYMVLHGAWCPHVSKYTKMAKSGGFTGRGYIKICSSSLAALRQWLRDNGRPDGSFTAVCPCAIKIASR